MTFSQRVHAQLDERLMKAGYRPDSMAGVDEAAFRSASYEVVVYFDIANMETDARVRKIGDAGSWSHIREVLSHADWPPQCSGEPVQPRPEAEIIADLGHLIERLPSAG